MVTIVAPFSEEDMLHLAEYLRNKFDQLSVLVTKHETHHTLVEAKPWSQAKDGDSQSPPCRQGIGQSTYICGGCNKKRRIGTSPTRNGDFRG